MTSARGHKAEAVMARSARAGRVAVGRELPSQAPMRAAAVVDVEPGTNIALIHQRSQRN